MRITLAVVAAGLIVAFGQAAAGPPGKIDVSSFDLASDTSVATGPPAPMATPAEPLPLDWIDWNGDNFFGSCSGDCSISLSGGRQITTTMIKIMLVRRPPWNWQWGDAGLVAGEFSRRLLTLWNALNIEPQLGIGKRFGDMQAAEFWGAIAARWTAFPWNDYIKTTVAISDGLSLATQVDTVERNANPLHAGSVLLNYFTPEITLALPDYQQYELVFSVHHRSLIREGTQFGMVGLRINF